MLVKDRTKIEELTNRHVNETIFLCEKLHYLHSSSLFDTKWKTNWLKERIKSTNFKGFIAIDEYITSYLFAEIRFDEYTKKPFGYIREIFVLDEVRKEGIGEKLLHSSERFFQKNSCRYFMLNCRYGNHNIMFFENLGLKIFSYEMIKKL